MFPISKGYSFSIGRDITDLFGVYWYNTSYYTEQKRSSQNLSLIIITSVVNWMVKNNIYLYVYLQRIS